jgi:hypothetical protein
MSKSPNPKPFELNSGELLTESQYQNMFIGCSELTQCPEMPNLLKTPVMFPKRGVAEPIPATSEPLSADGFDWGENERNAYEL